ncbi:M1 family metallopeptidase [Hufsiella ginkgonis]|uniref:Aminopeptidase N n=1 Tax=Hufsiella ginkgonis TaxID=2695274 RepID=A0A7K1XSS1_9SPHI|nr:M1 family aminopeptidase [Hufsiella ginkgonis]MXV13960.1 M1 family peptidase [Hufsiella ginkgonis]
MRIIPYTGFAAAMSLLISCSAPKMATMETINIGSGSSAPGVYHGSYPRITDILHTKLDISFDWDSAFVIGRATIDARPYFYPQNQVVLAARGFRIKQVAMMKTVAGSPDGPQRYPLNYAYDGKAITIHLDKTYTRDQKFTLFIDYVAAPYTLKVGKEMSSTGDRGIYFVNRQGKEKDLPRQVWTQGETESNSSWFPTIVGPQEKMTQEISITVPEKMVTLSNGDLDYSNKNGDGTRTDVWRQDKPHSTYLAMVAAGDFVITKDKWRDKEVNYYMEPKYAPYAKLIFGKTPEMIGFFSNKTGVAFPWDKYSQIVVRDFVSGAMENTTATVFFDKLNLDEHQYKDENYEEVIAHELFHHWFGDLVTCESWADLALNESFATYGEYLWQEFKYGRDDADYHGMEDMQRYLGDPFNKEYKLIRHDYTDREQLFDNVTYEKGGRILHMLRKTVGDDAFFKALNTYLVRYSYKNVEAADLRMVFEEVTGTDMNWFFDQWFLSAGHPKLNIGTRFDAAAGKVIVSIEQTQENSVVYRIPLSVDIYANGKKERKEIVLDKIGQVFTFPLERAPDLVNVDAEKYVLAEKTEEKSLEEAAFQYRNAPLFMDRLEAVNVLKNYYKKEGAAKAVMIKALGDQSWYIRKLAVDFVQELNSEERNQVYPVIQKMAVEDKRSYVRAAAVNALMKFYEDRNNTELLNKIAEDKAPSVIKVMGGW